MILQIYVLLVALACASTYHAVSRQDMSKSPAEEALAAAFAIMAFALLAIASENIEVVSNGQTVALSNGYLVVIWGSMALLNCLFLWIGPLEELADAAGKDLLGLKGGQRR